MATAARQEPFADRRLAAWAALCACGALAAMAWPWWHGEVYLADDLAAFHLPLRQFYRDCLRAGQPFDWLPTLWAGFYLTGEGQLGGYHPLHWALYRTLPLGTALGLETLLGYPAMWAGMWCWLRGRGVAREAAGAAALVLPLSSFHLLHLPHVNAVAICAHMPWLLWLIDRCAVNHAAGRSTLGPLVGVALLTGSQLLLGYPQYVWFSLLLEGAYGTSVWWTGGRSLRMVTGLVVAKAMGAALGAVQLLPTLDALAHSTRQTADASLPYYGSLHPLNLLQWIGPYLFTTRVVGRNTHELGCYLGAVPVALLVWQLTRVARKEPVGTGVDGRGLAKTALLISAMALWLAMGEYGGLYALQTWLPVVGKFRFPARYMAIVVWGVAVLAGLTLVQLQRAGGGRSTAGRPLSALVACSGLLALAAPWLFPGEFVAAWPCRLAGPVILMAASSLIMAAEAGWRGALPALLCLATIDQCAYGLSHSLLGKTGPLERVFQELPAAPGQRTDAVAMQLRSPDDAVLPYINHLSLCGRRTLDGYAGLEPARVLNYATVPALRAAGVGFVGRTSRTDGIPGLLPVDNAWLAVPLPLPRVRFVTQVLVSPWPAEEVSRIDLDTTAVVPRPLPIVDGPVGLAELVREVPGTLDIRTACATPQLLVVADSHHRGWRARVDGRPRDVVRANGDFLGVVVMPGETSVELRFAPDSLRYGKWISLTALAGVLGGWLAAELIRMGTIRTSSAVAAPCER